jgi:hypothetical protein
MLLEKRFKYRVTISAFSNILAYIVVIKNNDVEILIDLHVLNHLNPKRSFQNIVRISVSVCKQGCAPR